MTACRWPGCDREGALNGLCGPHYQRQRRAELKAGTWGGGHSRPRKPVSKLARGLLVRLVAEHRRSGVWLCGMDLVRSSPPRQRPALIRACWELLEAGIMRVAYVPVRKPRRNGPQVRHDGAIPRVSSVSDETEMRQIGVENAPEPPK